MSNAKSCEFKVGNNVVLKSVHGVYTKSTGGNVVIGAVYPVVGIDFDSELLQVESDTGVWWVNFDDLEFPVENKLIKKKSPSLFLSQMWQLATRATSALIKLMLRALRRLLLVCWRVCEQETRVKWQDLR